MSENKEEKKSKVVELILNRIRVRNDFPAMSRTMNLVGKQTEGSLDTSVTELTRTILDDFGLTNKLLKMVNSVAYINYHMEGKIGTISRAVFILGYDTVRNAALSLLLFENLGNKSVAVELKESVIVSFVSAVIAKELATHAKYDDVEEAFLCSIFHNLGKLLVAFYLPEKTAQIKQMIETEKVTENSASRSLLGSSYEDIGIGIAKAWNFPEKILNSIRRVPPGTAPEPANKGEELKNLVNFANEICLKMNDIRSNPNIMKILLRRYEGTIQITDKHMTKLLDTSMKEIARYARMLKLNVQQSSFLKRLGDVVTGTQSDESTESEILTPTDEAVTDLDDTQLLRLMMGQDDEEEKEESPDTILSNGIQEVAGSLMESTSINDILRTILEVMFRGLKFTRVLICVRSTSGPFMEGRFGFGQDTDKIIKKFKIPIGKTSDIFNLSLSRNSDIVIENINDPRIKSRIPQWYKDIVKAETFLLFPILINDMAIGIIYADKEKAGEIKIPPHQFTLLKTLRNQAVMAIQRKR